MRTLVALVALSIPSLGAAQDRQIIAPPNTSVGLPFSIGVRTGNLIFLSGQIGNKPGTRELADTGITGQTRQTLDNIKAVLAFAGSSLERVVKCTVFLTNIADYQAMNAVYATYFPTDPPAARRRQRVGAGRARGDRVHRDGGVGAWDRRSAPLAGGHVVEPAVHPHDLERTLRRGPERAGKEKRASIGRHVIRLMKPGCDEP